MIKTARNLFYFIALFLMACANIDETPALALPSEAPTSEFSSSELGGITQKQADEFTTSGKATKLRNTPEGPVYIYDISKDPEVAQAIKDLYAEGNKTFGDVSFRHYSVDNETFFSPDLDVTPATQLLTKARKIAFYDLYRSSCQKVERVPCGVGNSEWFHSFRSDCPTCTLGKAPDPKVERLATAANRATQKLLTEDEIAKGRWPSFVTPSVPSIAYINQCREISKQPLLPYFYIGKKSGYSLEDTEEFLLHHVCADE